MRVGSNSAEYSDNGEDVENNNAHNYVKRNRPKGNLPQPHMLPRKSNTTTSVWTILSASFALSCVFYVLYTTTLFIYFVSGNGSGMLKQKHASSDTSLLEMIIQDAWLLALFVIQHTIMARRSFKSFMSHLIPAYLHRSMYILFTGVTIQLLTSSWVSSLTEPSSILWDYSTSYSACLACQLLHFFAWMYTLAVVFMLDFPEFLGLKQVYYHANNFGCPMSAKSLGAQRFFGHFRHASATGLLIILWLVPCMTLDRLLLAFALTLYLFSTYVDQEDALYVTKMYERKIKTLRHK